MSDFAYMDARLHAEGVALEDIAAEVGTPFYCYSVAAMERRYGAFARAFDGLGDSVLFREGQFQPCCAAWDGGAWGGR